MIAQRVLMYCRAIVRAVIGAVAVTIATVFLSKGFSGNWVKCQNTIAAIDAAHLLVVKLFYCRFHKRQFLRCIIADIVL